MSRAIRLVDSVPVKSTTFRDYQVAMLDRAIELLHKHHVLIQSPTGSGKTTIARALAYTILGGRRFTHVIFAAPQTHIENGFTLDRGERTEWGTDSLRTPLTIPADFIRAARDDRSHEAGCAAILGYLGTRRPRHALVTTHAALSYLVRKHGADIPNLGKCLLIVDEAHHAGADSLSKVVARWVADKARIVNLTATPSRRDGRDVVIENMKVIRRSMTEQMMSGWAPGRFASDVVSFGSADLRVTAKQQRGDDFVKSDDANREFARSAARKWVADGKPRTIFRLPPMKGGSRTVVGWLIKELEKVGARVFDATGSGKKYQGPFLAMLKSEKESGYLASRFDVIIGCQRVVEGTDWPHCSAVYVLGIPGSIPMVAQLIGRATRSKKAIEGYPAEFVDLAKITFFVPKGTTDDPEEITLKHSKNTLMVATYLADYEVAGEWLLTRAVRDGLSSSGGLGDPFLSVSHGLDDETRMRVMVAMAGVRQENPSARYDDLLKAAIQAAPDEADRAGVIKVVLATMGEDDRIGPDVLKAVKSGAEGVSGVEVNGADVEEELRERFEAIVEDFKGEAVGSARGLDRLEDQGYELTGEGMEVWAERMHRVYGRWNETLLKTAGETYRRENGCYPSRYSGPITGMAGRNWSGATQYVKKEFGMSIPEFLGNNKTDHPDSDESLLKAMRAFMKVTGKLPACNDTSKIPGYNVSWNAHRLMRVRSGQLSHAGLVKIHFPELLKGTSRERVDLETQQKLRSMIEDGRSVQSAAVLCGISRLRASVIARDLVARMREEKNSLVQTNREETKKLRENGHTYVEIAEILGVHKGYIPELLGQVQRPKRIREEKRKRSHSVT